MTTGGTNDMTTRSMTLVLTALAVLVQLAWSATARADAVTDWNERAATVAAVCGLPAGDPFHESRLYAMVHIAVHDAVNAIDRRSRPYAYEPYVDVPPATSLEAAVAAAARDVMVAELPRLPAVPFAPCVAPAIDQANTFYDAALAAIPDGEAKSDGIELGQAAALAIVTQRAFDNSMGIFLDFAFEQGSAPGEYRFTSAFPFAAAPQWGEVTPFVLQDAAQFRPPAPYSVSCGQPSPDLHSGQCRKYAEDFAEVKAVGADDVTGNTRTADQTQVAFFWIESSPTSWNRLGRSLSAEAGLDPWQNARLFGILNTAMADGYIASMHAKYYYRFWRPETAIQAAANDGNPYTEGDELWMPADPTPPIPDYDSAHAVEGAAAAEVFRQYFGTDEWSFEVCSRSLPDPDEHCGGPSEVLRSFTRFSDAAAENGDSRVFNGYHFRDAVNAGLKHGRKIGAAAARGYFRPVGKHHRK